MDTLMLIGQIASIACLAYGGWLCFIYAGIYDADSARADADASLSAQTRAHADDSYPPLDLAA